MRGARAALVFLVGVLSGLALLSTLWSATTLRPMSDGYELATQSWSVPGDAEREDENFERVSEVFLLQQMVRGFLAAPWRMAGIRGRVSRQPSAAGWSFPVIEEGEEAEEGEAARIASSASAVLSRKCGRPCLLARAP